MSYFGTNEIGKLYLGTTEIAKAYLGLDLVYQKSSGPTPTNPIKRLQYITTDGNSYMLAPVLFSTGKNYVFYIDMQFVGSTNGRGTGWNAGAAITIQNGSYSNGSARLSPYIGRANRAYVTVIINGSTTSYEAVYNGATSTGSRSNSSLANYAGSTKYPIGTMTNTGGAVPYQGVSIRLYSVKIDVDGVTVFDAYPAQAILDVDNDVGSTSPSGTNGLYDTITEKLYINKGSGTISAGPESN